MDQTTGGNDSTIEARTPTEPNTKVVQYSDEEMKQMISSNKGIIDLQRIVNGLKYDVKSNQENSTKAMRD